MVTFGVLLRCQGSLYEMWLMWLCQTYMINGYDGAALLARWQMVADGDSVLRLPSKQYIRVVSVVRACRREAPYRKVFPYGVHAAVELLG
jgi:hypothetical protein